MSSITPQKRKADIDSLIDNSIFDNNKLVYTFLLHLYSNQEIEECIDYVQGVLDSEAEKHLIYYKLWMISLEFLRGYYKQAKQEFLSLSLIDIDKRVLDFYLIELGFDDLYNDFVTEETEHFIFHIHPERYKKQNDLRHKIERRELGYELVGKDFFGIILERKIHYFLWEDSDMKNYFSASHTCSCYGVIQEGEYNRDWHESAHVYNYLYGMESTNAFILEGIAVFNDGRKGSVRLSYANAAYIKTGITPSIYEWWKDPIKFRNTNSWIAYTTAGYFILKLKEEYGKEKLLQLTKHQTYDDACRIYGETALCEIISKTEYEIIGT